MCTHRTRLGILVSTLVAAAPFIAAGAEHRRTYEEMAAGSDKVILGTVGQKNSYFGNDSRI